MSSKLNSYINIADLQQRAHKALPLPVKDYLEGGADDEYTLSRNLDAFSEHELIPRFLVDVSTINTSTTVLGAKVDLPVLLSPTGMSRLFHPDAELAVARAAEQHGTMYSLSAVATESIESVADISAGPKMAQIYVLKDKGFTSDFIQRCKAANYTALCLTVDVPVGGNRERDLRSGLTFPPKFTWRSNLSFALHPKWSLGQLTGPKFDLKNLNHLTDNERASLGEKLEYLFSQFKPSVSWADAEQMVSEWGGPFAIKGIMNAEDARQAVAIGASAIIISNHGGRQLDTVPATLDCLADIVAAVDGRAEVILDGGIRRGTDVLKAMALGANACMIGRPYLYGLSVAGQQGVERVLDIFKTEIERNLALIGCPNINDIDATFIRHR
jgi:L-lactate dehydrogenase (cytochrome)